MLACQVATATVIWYAAGLALDSYNRITTIDLGFAPNGLYAVELPIAFSRAAISRADAAAAQRLVSDLSHQTAMDLASARGVVAAAFATTWPMGPAGAQIAVAPSTDPRTYLDVHVSSIDRSAVGVMGTHVVDGVEPSIDEIGARGTDDVGLRMCLANEALAARLRPFGAPVGQILLVAGKSRYKVQAVIQNMREVPIDTPVSPRLLCYLPPLTGANVLLVRLQPGQAARSSVEAVLKRSWGAVADQPHVIPLEPIVDESMAEYRARGYILGAVTALSVPIVLLGTGGFAAFLIRARLKTIAIQLALGATWASVHRHAIMTTSTAVICGATAGAGLAVLLRQILATYTYGIGGVSAYALLEVGVCMLLTGTVGAFVSIRVARRADPLMLLRRD